MAFGQKTGSLKNLKKSLAKGGGKGFIKYIPKNGSMNVRFIQEPEEWVNYVEHFDQMLRKSFPCNGEQNCPGCTSGERKSSRYLANAVDLDDNNRVIPLQLPKDLANRLVVKYEKWGTLTDRDIELSRQGEGLDTVYDLDPSVPDRKNIAKFTPIDLLKTLEEAYDFVFGDSDDEDDEDEVPVKAPARGRKKSAAAGVARGGTKPPVDTDDDVDEDDEAEVEEAPAKPAKKAAKKAAVPEPEFEPDDEEDEEPEEEDEPEAEEDDDDVEYDEETLRALPFGALRSVARDFGVSTKGKDADTIIAEIMDAGEVVEDDDDA